MSATIWSIEVFLRSDEAAESAEIGGSLAKDPRGRAIEGDIRSLGWSVTPGILVTDLYFVRDERGDLESERIEAAADALFADPVTQVVTIVRRDEGASTDEASADEAPCPGGKTPAHRATVLNRPGVMDPVEASALRGLADLGIENVSVRTAQRYYFFGDRLDETAQQTLTAKVLSNPVIEAVAWDAEAVEPSFGLGGEDRAQRQEVRLIGLSDAELEELSRTGQLSLNRGEMRAIEAHFRGLGRNPTDVELETLAQTWSEHCCHKTFSGLISVRRRLPDGSEETEEIDNLLKRTIRRATETINAPWCLSVFEDNAGVIAFDDELGVSFKVETHNHPSAIEPYGGAGTGIGGVVRDTLGTGLGAKPIVNTDVFCFGAPDLPWDELPAGTVHPLRVLRGVVSGVRDYGNRMGIPTASGALYFDERYVGNPLVYCGSVGVIPRSAVAKEVKPGDLVYAIGGRTGRDGIHGATFSSIELTEESEMLSSGAVQIGNAITEKKVLDVLLEARDRGLYRSITDCGAGGFSSAVGEMGAECGARVDLERVPLKYHGLSYTEIWISEAQERMVFSVPPEHAEALETLANSEDVECTAIGEFTDTGRLELFYHGTQVADLSMEVLHDGRPRTPISAVIDPPEEKPNSYPRDVSPARALNEILSSPNVASKEWVIRQYDHEVQGHSVLKPLQGPAQDGPGDGVAFTVRNDSDRAVVIGCGMNPCYGDLDPYRMAMAAIDEALRNVVAVGGDPERAALLDNFSWGNTRRPEVLGTLVEAARGCHDAAVGFGTPFISGKDSLNNEYQVGDKVISIPPSLLISSLTIVDDAHQLVSMDLKAVGSRLIAIGQTRDELGGSHYFRHCGGDGGVVPAVDCGVARQLFKTLFEAIQAGFVLSAHDLSEGGLAVAAAEMAFAGGIGCELACGHIPGADAIERIDTILFSESNSRFLLEVHPTRVEAILDLFADLPAAEVGETIAAPRVRFVDSDGECVLDESLDTLKSSWKRLTESLVQ